MDSLYNSIHSYAGTAISDIGGQADQAAYYNTAAWDSFSALNLYGYTDHYYMDLGDYLSKINATPEISASVKSAASSVNNSLNNAVVYQTQCYYPDASGLTIFHNIWNSGLWYYDPALYESILSFGSNDWADYISVMDTLTILLEPDGYEPDDTPATASSITVDAAAQDHSIHITTDVDLVYFYATNGSNYTITADAAGDILDMYLYEEGDYINDIGYGWVGNPIYFSCSQDGNYYIQIDSYISQVGDYSIQVQSGTLHYEDPIYHRSR
jgi:hypothetical protein